MNDEYNKNSSEKKDKKLVVFYVEAYEDKSGLREAGLRDKFKGLIVKSREIGVNDFKENLSRFLLSVEDILSTSKERYGSFSMESVEINAEVSADGKVGFMGTEVGISGTHGIKFVFKKFSST